ncbi:MAG: acetyl-CoA carboxylase, biotin carboxyl carrier protein, partial [Imperialibacter sp.]
MKAKEIQDLIDFISKSGLEEVNIETEEFKIKVKRNSDAPRMVEHMPAAPAPVAAAAAAPAAPAPKSGNDESKYLTIKSPMI